MLKGYERHLKPDNRFKIAGTLCLDLEVIC